MFSERWEKDSSIEVLLLLLLLLGGCGISKLVGRMDGGEGGGGNELIK